MRFISIVVDGTRLLGADVKLRRYAAFQLARMGDVVVAAVM